MKLNQLLWEDARIITILLRKWCYSDKEFSQLLPHHGGKTSSGIDMVWRNYVTVTQCIRNMTPWQWRIFLHIAIAHITVTELFDRQLINSLTVQILSDKHIWRALTRGRIDHFMAGVTYLHLPIQIRHFHFYLTFVCSRLGAVFLLWPRPLTYELVLDSVKINGQVSKSKVISSGHTQQDIGYEQLKRQLRTFLFRS